MGKKFQNKLTVPQSDESIKQCQVEFATEFEFPKQGSNPNRLSKNCPKKK
ncbi:MAG: hypothetical protein FWF59_02945 [Turicibacter sp.]|nr:hypothetical protein [Turicibacter sp.]